MTGETNTSRASVPQVGNDSPYLGRVAAAAFLQNALVSFIFTALSVATPYIGTALGASSQEELWLTDAFLIALICVTPFSGFLAARLGRRSLLLVCAALTTCLFTAGALFGSLPLLTALCFLAGASSASVVPTTQAALVHVFPGERRSVAMAVWGAGTTTGILLGAALTGWALTGSPWQTVFLTVWPVGIAALALTLALPRSSEPPAAPAFKLDPYETILLLASLLGLGVFVNLGDNVGWFRSPFIAAAFGIFLLSAPLYAWRARHLSGGLLGVSVLRNVPFAVASGFTFGAAFFSTGQFQIDLLGGPLALHPDVLSLRSSLGAAALLAGVVLGGVRLRLVSIGRLVAGAFVVVLVGKYAFTRYTFGLTVLEAVWPQIVTGFGLGLISTPLAVWAYKTLPHSATKDAASLFALGTQLGSAFGIALLGIVLSLLQNRRVSLVTPGRSSLEPFYAVFWIEFFGTVLLLLTTLLAFRSRKNRS